MKFVREVCLKINFEEYLMNTLSQYKYTLYIYYSNTYGNSRHPAPEAPHWLVLSSQVMDSLRYIGLPETVVD